MRSVSPGNWDTLSRKTHNTNAFFAQCFGNTKTRAAYLHTLILLSPHLPQVHSQRHHALSPDLPHKHHIYSCHTYHTQWHTEPHMLIYFGSACHEETNTKSENKTKKTNKNSTKFGATLLWRLFLAHCTHCYWYARFSFLIFGIAAVPSYIHQKNPKLRVQHTWFLEIGFVIVFSQKQDIKNNNGEFAILKMVWCASGHIKLPFLDSRTKTSTSNYIAVMCGYQKLYKKY